MQSTFTPSTYQQTVFDFITSGTGNAVINAVAGSGKTTTIVKCLELIPEDKTIYFIAFNKAIVEELKTRVPAHVNVSTFHSLGAKALYATRKSQLDDKRVYNAVSNMRADWYAAEEDKELIDADYLARVRKLTDLYRLNLVGSPEELFELAKKHGIEVMNGEAVRAMQVLSALGASNGTHDFVDMIYLPAIDPSVKLPKADYIFVDECQDLNKAQQYMLRKMMHADTRFIAVGDPHQAIYGFAGADSDSFNNLVRMPNTVQLALSINYRSDTDIINMVHEFLPHIDIQARPGAPAGVRKDSDSFRSIEDGDMVLCRNTAPLVKMCLEFIRDGRKAFVKGGDIGKQLANMVVRSNAKTLDKFETHLKNELAMIYSRISKKNPSMEHGEIIEEPAYAVFAGKKQVFETIIDTGMVETPYDLVSTIERIFSDSKVGVCFSSVHKSKGLENKRVFIIERELMPSPFAKKNWQKEQEDNLLYVAITRAKNYIGIVTDWQFKKRKN